MKIKGKKYVPLVLQIVKRDELNRPVKAVIKYDDDEIDLKSESNDFMIVFAREDTVKVRAEGTA